MKINVYVFKWIIALLTFAAGCGIYWTITYWQTVPEVPVEVANEIPATCLTETEYLKQFTEISNYLDELKAVNLKKEETSNIENFYPDGEYVLYEDVPKAFKNIEFISLQTYDWNTNDDKPKSLTPKGFLKAQKSYKFSKISINNRLISFETETVNNVSYKFIGEYPDYSDNSEYKGYDLKGTMTKYKNNKKIAKTMIAFYVEGC
jgi:hypothetical protein